MKAKRKEGMAKAENRSKGIETGESERQRSNGSVMKNESMAKSGVSAQ